MTRRAALFQVSLLYLAKRGQIETDPKQEKFESDFSPKNFVLHDAVPIVFLAVHDNFVFNVVGLFIEVEKRTADLDLELFAYKFVGQDRLDFRQVHDDFGVTEFLQKMKNGQG